MLIKKKKGTQRQTNEIKKSGGDKLELNETSPPLSVNNVQIIADGSFCIMMCVRERARDRIIRKFCEYVCVCNLVALLPLVH